MYELTNVKETMTSVEIAELINKPHNDVMKAIRAMEPAWKKVCKGKFSLTSRAVAQPNGGTRNIPCYELTKTECIFVATKFNDEARAMIILRWEQLEKEKAQNMPQVPKTFREALLLAAEQQGVIEEQQLLISQQKEQINEQAPKVTFADAITGSQGSILIGELAKLLTQNGVKIGQNRLFEWLRENEFLGKTGSYYNVPNQKYVEQKIFEIKEGLRRGKGEEKQKYFTTKVTGKGQEYFVNGFLSGRFTI